MRYAQVLQTEMADTRTMTEPEIIPALLVSGFAVDIRDGIVRLDGWVDIAEGENSERRVITRLAMSDQLARRLLAALRNGLAQNAN